MSAIPGPRPLHALLMGMLAVVAIGALPWYGASFGPDVILGGDGRSPPTPRFIETWTALSSKGGLAGVMSFCFAVLGVISWIAAMVMRQSTPIRRRAPGIACRAFGAASVLIAIAATVQDPTTSILEAGQPAAAIGMLYGTTVSMGASVAACLLSWSMIKTFSGAVGKGPGKSSQSLPSEGT